MNTQANAQEIINRSNNLIWADKSDEYREGLEETKEQYDDRFTQSAKNEAIAEYKENKTQAIQDELDEFDAYSEQLINDTLEQIDKEMTEDEMLVHPQTDFEFKQHAYYVNEISNELATTFIGNDVSTDRLDSVLKRGHQNNLYALAVLSNRKEILDRLRNNDSMRADFKSNVEAQVKHKFDVLREKVMPERYKRNAQSKRDIELHRVSATNKRMMYDIVHKNNYSTQIWGRKKNNVLD
ncbi:hypothetical protein LOY18_12030 [Staphylococcus capitis]|uniref:hypothetical protein n=1 Tax=Staphylococcus capitis TaxID=29388 RepID=UPI001E5DF8B7|nr:hypothetical protein [Staphylococcus capitis]MCC9117510.1 hypothetical protein [Staphylococcus capitis]MCC9143964.1 hypothetical protein [Staphylococcus capitis]